MPRIGERKRVTKRIVKQAPHFLRFNEVSTSDHSKNLLAVTEGDNLLEGR